MIVMGSKGGEVLEEDNVYNAWRWAIGVLE
jgi:hypothetical protein